MLVGYRIGVEFMFILYYKNYVMFKGKEASVTPSTKDFETVGNKKKLLNNYKEIFGFMFQNTLKAKWLL